MAEPAGDKGAIEMIQPANPLKAKVGPPRPQIPDLLIRAEAALQDMAGDYLGWVAHDIEALQALVARVTADAAEERAEALQAIYSTAHDIKGQGGTFDFALVTMVAASLCRYLEKRRADARPDPAILTAHIDALRVVVRNGIKGDGGAIGTALVDGLAKAVDRGLARETAAGP